jgi:hypothetical protein
MYCGEELAPAIARLVGKHLEEPLCDECFEKMNDGEEEEGSNEVS